MKALHSSLDQSILLAYSSNPFLPSFLPPSLPLSLLAPGDRSLWFRILFQHTLSSSEEGLEGRRRSTHLLKVVNKEGVVGLYLLTVANVLLPSLATGGGGEAEREGRGGGSGGKGEGSKGEIRREMEDGDIVASSSAGGSSSSGGGCLQMGFVLKLDPCPPSRYLAGGVVPRKPPPSSPCFPDDSSSFSSSSFSDLPSSAHAGDEGGREG